MTKTESEAYFRVKAVEPGEEIEAFMKILMGTSGMGLQDKARQVMAPVAPKPESKMPLKLA